MAAQIISFHCILKNRFGQIISNTTNREVLTSNDGQFSKLKALSKALEGLKPGEKRTVTISAADAYGFYDPKLAFTRLRRELDGGDDLKLGEVVDYVREGNRGMFRVTEANSIYVALDGNHPLAGQDLVFEIEATESRAAVAEELIEALTESAAYLH